MTDIQIKQELEKRRKPVLCVGAGLYLLAGKKHAPDARSWAYRYKIDGKARTMGLGAYKDVTLAKARIRAEEVRAVLRRGEDPLAIREATVRARRLQEARAVTFKTLAESYIKANRAGWKNAKHADQWEATLKTYAYPLLGERVVGAIDANGVLAVLQQDVLDKGMPARPLWEARPETASRLRQRIEAILDYAKSKGLREGDNPASWGGNLKFALPRRSKVKDVKHHAALAVGEMAAFMATLRAKDGMAARALEFTILTAARTGEAIGATWREFDLAASTWTIPANRMKSGREHRVPLSGRALAIVNALKTNDVGAEAYVFPGARAGQPLSNMAMLELLRGMKPGLTVHGFRSSFRDWVAEETPYSGDLAERALAHTIPNATESAYTITLRTRWSRMLTVTWF